MRARKSRSEGFFPPLAPSDKIDRMSVPRRPPEATWASEEEEAALTRAGSRAESDQEARRARDRFGSRSRALETSSESASRFGHGENFRPIIPRRPTVCAAKARAKPLPENLFRHFAVLLAAAAAFVFAAGCGIGADARLARRILEDHRRITHGRPLPASQVIRLALSRPGSPATGSLRIEWNGRNYRETFTSAAATSIRGIQGERGYFTDVDGVTRVISDPILAQLVTRSYFWRRAYCFDDAERARLALGPADAEHVSVRMTPLGGNSLLLTLDRRTLQLSSVTSAGLALQFESESRWRDLSWKGAAVSVEHRHTGLPTDGLVDATIGGWSAAWTSPVVDAPFQGSDEPAVIVRGSIGGADARIAVDAGVDGPIRIRPSLAGRLRIVPDTDVLGRKLLSGVRFAIGGFSEPSVHAEISDDIPPGADAAVGGALWREAIVEYDTPAGRLRLSDPARWVRPEGYYRAVLDDDGDRPVGILKRKGKTLRVTAGVSSVRALTLAVSSATRTDFSEQSRAAEGLFWGPAALPPLDLVPVLSGFDPPAGDDGALSSRFLRRFRAVIDMTHRWAYLKPESGPAPKED